MHHDVVHPGGFGDVGQRHEMRVVAVHSAIREQAEKMQAMSARLREGRAQDFVRSQFSIGDRLVNPG